MAEYIAKSVYQIVGNPMCVEASDGEKVCRIISEFLKNDKKISLSFQNIEMITSAFLNSAIGVLYGKFDEQKIKSSVKIQDLNATDAMLLKRVIETAKLFYKDPDGMKKSIQDALEG